MFSGVRNFFREHGLIIIILIAGLFGALLLVWWRLGFTLEFFQPFAAQQCQPGDSCGGHGCGSGGLCNKCGFPGASGAQADADCAGNANSCNGSQWFCVSEGKGFNHCVEDTSTCTTGGGGGGGGGPSAQAQFSITNKNYTPGGCDTASSLGSSAHANVNVTDAGNVNTHIVFNVFHSDTAGCSATNQQPSGGGSRTGVCDFGPHGTGTCTLSYAIGTHNCGRVQFDAAFSDGALTPPVFIGQVINYGVDCSAVAPPTHLECQSNACVSVSGSGTNQCASNADCGGGATHMACQNNACTQVAGAGADTCASNADCAAPTHMACQNNACVQMAGAGTDTCTTDVDCTETTALACQPASQNRDIDQTANFTATGGTGTYAWTAPAGSPASGNGATFGASYAAAGTRTVTVTSGTETAECTVTVTEESQDLACSPESQTVEIDQIANISVSGGTGTYAWTAPNGEPASGTGGSIGVSYGSSGTYTVTVRDSETQLSQECDVIVQAPETTMMGVPGLQLQKYVISSGGDEVKTRSANPNQTVEFVLKVRSNGTDDLLDVRVRDAVPSGLSYVSGTARLDGGQTISDADMLSEIELGDMSPGASHEITFDARVSNESFFDYGTTTLVNTAFADADNAPEVSDVAFVTITRDPENPYLSLRKLGRNVSRNEIGERTSVAASPNEVIEFTVRVRNVSDVDARNVHVRDIVPQGISFQSGSATLNGQPSSDLLVSGGINIGTLEPGEEAIIRFLGRVAPANQLPSGSTTLINVALTWADEIPTLQAQLPVIISSAPVTIPPVETGPGETTVLALIISTIVTLMYIGYTSTDTFRRREAEHIAGSPRSGSFTKS